jgi:hypothetical protein
MLALEGQASTPAARVVETEKNDRNGFGHAPLEWAQDLRELQSGRSDTFPRRAAEAKSETRPLSDYPREQLTPGRIPCCANSFLPA